jgi:DNA-binding IclR family transcriptional regulator
LARFTAKTITDPALLQARFAQIRKQRVAVSHGELDEQVLGIAAPIRDARGSVVAAVSISALASRVPRGRLKSIAVAVKSAAATIPEHLSVVDI